MKQQQIGIFILRVSLGLIWIYHAIYKLHTVTLQTFGKIIAKYGLPEYLSLPFCITQLICGLMLLIGFYSKTASLFIIPIALFNLYTHIGNGFLYINNGFEYHLFLLLTTITHILVGNGAFCIKKIN